jgi:putative permease
MIVHYRRAIQRQQRLKFLFLLGALVLLFLSLVLIKNVFVSFLLAFVIYYVLAPVVDFLERKGLSRQWGTTIPFLVLIGSGAVLINIFSPIWAEQLSSLKDAFPKYIETSGKLLENLESQTTSLLAKIYPVDLRATIQPQIMGYAQNLFQDLPTIVSKSLVVVLLTPFFAYFMLLDGRDFVRKLLALVPNQFFELGLNLNHQIGGQMGGFIRAKILESSLVGFVIWLGLVILGFPYALVLAVFAGIMNIIPYLGPFIGVVPALMIAFSTEGSYPLILWILLIYALAQALDIVLIVPFVVAKIVDLHPVTVILVIIAGSQLMGVLGMIISIPFFSAAKVSAISIYKHLTDFRV